MKLLRNNILMVSMAAASMMMTGCAESFLDVSSKTESTTDNNYRTEGDAWRALIGCYDGWRQVSSAPGIGFYCASIICSDETYGATGNGDGRGWQVVDRFDQNQSPADLNIYEQDWKSYYAAVYRCNELIAHEDQINWAPGGKQGTYMGEVRGLRALLYFDMVRMWGNIPLYTEPVNENKPQVPADDVYTVIFDDLKYAIENIPADAYPKAQASSNDGHFTKFAAEAILARAYLFYTGYYGHEPAGVTAADALAACEDVIANSGCSLVPEYKDLWAAASLVPMSDGSKGWDPTLSTYAGEANSEIVLQMKFTPSQDYNGNNDSNRWQVMVGMRSINSSPYGKGWGGCTVCPSYVDMYESGDKRLTASVIDLEGEGITSLDAFEASYKDQREYTGYSVKKYSPLCYADGSSAVNGPDQDEGGFQEQNPQNWVIVRLADVMLMAAELGSSKAQSYLDQIRSRAGLASVPANKANILKERAFELAFEGHRYWDLLRQGIDYAANTIAASSGKVHSGAKDDYVDISAAKIKATNGLMQIPYNQIVLSNGVLHQNPGW